MAGGGRSRKKIANDKKGGKRKKTIVTTAKAKTQDHHQVSSPSSPRRSKYVGVSWDKEMKKWNAQITINGKKKNLGYYHDEKEAARMYDEQAIILGKPVNFPLDEGMEQAVKAAPRRKDVPKLPNVNRQSKYVGVSWSKHNKKWMAAIRIDGKPKNLGRYRDEKEAARIYDDGASSALLC